jgi:hypothetical protein
MYPQRTPLVDGSGRLGRPKPRRGRGQLLVLVLLVWAGAHPVRATGGADVDARLDLLFGVHEPYRIFLRDLQTAIARNARDQVAAMVSYPLRTRIAGKWVRLKTRAQFLDQYDALLPARTRSIIVQATYDGLFANSSGVMLGDGQVWFSATCPNKACTSRSVKIIALNP